MWNIITVAKGNNTCRGRFRRGRDESNNDKEMKEKQFEDINTCQRKQDLQGKVQMRTNKLIAGTKKLRRNWFHGVILNATHQVRVD